jgi:BON domain
MREEVIIMKYSALPSLMLAGALAVGLAACDRDASRTPPPPADERAREAPGTATPGATREPAGGTGGAVGTAGQTAAGAVETIDVKSALTLDDGIDASDINVDTDGVKKVVMLKGSVPSAAQKNRAEQIAAREAKGYRIDNQLAVRAR